MLLCLNSKISRIFLQLMVCFCLIITAANTADCMEDPNQRKIDSDLIYDIYSESNMRQLQNKLNNFYEQANPAEREILTNRLLAIANQNQTINLDQALDINEAPPSNTTRSTIEGYEALLIWVGGSLLLWFLIQHGATVWSFLQDFFHDTIPTNVHNFLTPQQFHHLTQTLAMNPTTQRALMQLFLETVTEETEHTVSSL